MAEDFEDRTEQPTEHRRGEARRQGNVARSVDLTAAGLMLATAAALALFGTSLTQSLAELLHRSLAGPPLLSLTRESAVAAFWDVAADTAALAVPVMLLMAAAALAVNLVQVGFLFVPEVIQPKLERLDPRAGLRRIVSMQALVKLVTGLGKLLLVCVVGGWAVDAALSEFLQLGDLEWQTSTDPAADEAFRERRTPPLIVETIRRATVSLAFQLAGALVLLAVLDFGYQKWKHERELRMTKEELREEMKTMEGDPHIRQRRREAHRKLAAARQLQQVKDADVVITNPTHIAVALKYEPESMAAPTVVAKGMGEIAQRIRQLAAEHGVPVIERKPLARALYRQVKVGQAIPVDMYEVFVEIMAYVYRLAGRTVPKPP